MADFPNRIRELRTARGWSLEALAQKVGCSKVQISELERGLIQLTVDWMRRIAEPLGVTPAELLAPSDNPLMLSETERGLIERYRSATPDQQQSLERVTEALIPYRIEKRDDKAA